LVRNRNLTRLSPGWSEPHHSPMREPVLQRNEALLTLYGITRIRRLPSHAAK
jgi:hypothetical protein